MRFIESINIALDNLLKTYPEVLFFGEDLADPYGGAFKASKGLSTKYPDRVISTPISEAAIIGIAGGMAIGGLKPIVEIMFGDFIMLGADQLLNHLVKYEWMYNEKVRVPVVIRTPMGGRRGYGPTHSQSLEPILASIPNLKLISPTYYHNPGKLLKYAVINEPGVKVFCEYKMNYPKVLVNESNCPEGISIKRSKGNFPTVYLSNSDFEDPEILFISHGGNCILVEQIMIELLMAHELSVQGNFPSLIKPLPKTKEIFIGVENCGVIIILEESAKSFGWGSEIVALLVENNLVNDKKVIRIGMDEHPIPSSALLEQNVLPSVEGVLKEISNLHVL